MGQPANRKGIVRTIAAILCVPILLFGSSFIVDAHLLSKARRIPAAMSKRLKVLIVCLGLVSLATIIAIEQANRDFDNRPKVSFTVQNVTTNATGKTATIIVKNAESCPVLLYSLEIQLEGPTRLMIPASGSRPRMRLMGHSECSLSIGFPTSEFPAAEWEGGSFEDRRWCVVCMAQREMPFQKVRVRAAQLPLIDRWFPSPRVYSLASPMVAP